LCWVISQIGFRRAEKWGVFQMLSSRNLKNFRLFRRFFLPVRCESFFFDELGVLECIPLRGCNRDGIFPYILGFWLFSVTLFRSWQS
jgi:hypothetical protein